MIQYDPEPTAGEALSSTFTLILGTDAVTFDVLTTAVGVGEGNSFTAQRLRSTPVPEPSALVLVALGMVGLAGWRRTRA